MFPLFSALQDLGERIGSGWSLVQLGSSRGEEKNDPVRAQSHFYGRACARHEERDDDDGSDFEPFQQRVPKPFAISSGN